MAITNVGRVGFVHRGEYSPYTVYKRLDVVFYNNGTYAYNHNIALADILPTNAIYWEVMIDPTALNEAAAAAQAVVDQAAPAQIILQDASAAILAANTATGNANAATTSANNAANEAEEAALLAQQTVASAIEAANITIANSIDASELSIADTIAAANVALNNALEDAANDVAAAVLLAEAATTDANDAATQALNATELAEEVVMRKAFINPRGVHNFDTYYNFLDLVSFEGTSYLYVSRATTKGMSPNDPMFWMTFAAKGDGTGVDGLLVVDGKLYLTEKGVVVSNGVTMPTGGGGGGTSGSITLTNLMDGTIISAAKGASTVVSFNYVSNEYDGPGTVYIYVNEILKATKPLATGDNSIDVAAYVGEGTNIVRFYCSDIYSNYKNITYTVNVVDLKLLSTFDGTLTYTGDITYRYTPYGNLDKTIHFLLDDVEIGSTVVSTTGKQVTRVIPAPTHGTHKLEVYMTAEIGGNILTSPSIVYDVMCVVVGETAPMMGSYYGVTSARQGDLLDIPFVVYDPTTAQVEVTLTITSNSETYSTQTRAIGRAKQSWTTRDYPSGTVTFSITYGALVKSHTLTIEEYSVPVTPVTNDLKLHLAAAGKTNSQGDRDSWTYGEYTTTFQNLNWVETGWKQDSHGDAVLRLSGPAKAIVNMAPFTSDARTLGRTIEIEFAIRDVSNRNAKPITCMNSNIGLEVGADTATLKSEQSAIRCIYKDNERNRVSFVIESSSEYRLMSVYLNGVISGVTQYPTNDNFQQSIPANISIGTPECVVDIYTIRVYDMALTKEDVRDNFIADMPNIADRAALYNENNALYDEFGNLSFVKMKDYIPTMVITGQLPLAKGDKRQVNVTYTDPKNPQLNFEHPAEIDVQGTSSQFYVRKNYKLKFQRIESDGSKTKIFVQHAPEMLTSNVFTMKADYAESTSTHNTQIANYAHEIYEELNVKTPPQEVYEGLRTTVHGFPCVIYHKQDSTSPQAFIGKYNFNYDKGSLSVYGFTAEYPLAESWEFLNNTSDSCLFKSEMDTSYYVNEGDEVHAWMNDFEARQPEDYYNMTAFKVMHDWVVSTCQENATGDALAAAYTDNRNVIHTVDNAAYRLAKFRTEFTQHFDMGYATVYYLLTLILLMSDQRAKNMFLTTWDGIYWEPWFYDNDTALGINNEGVLAFDYFHEDIDTIGSANVYNGQMSTLWVNFRQAFSTEIGDMYLELRASGMFTYEKILDRFITQGSDKWSVSIYNEDADYKYIDMARTNNDTTNLYQARGTGEEHLRYFMGNRIKYFDSKWYAPEYADDFVSLRIYTPSIWAGVEPNANITLTPFSDMYAGIRYKANADLLSQRVVKNIPVTFTAPPETFNDTEVGIYGASQIASLGDLSPLYCGTINVSKAEKLQELIIGNPSTLYENTNLLTLSIGSNKLLRKIDLRGCVNFEQPLNLSGCPNIEEIYAERTKITGVELPSSGYIKKMRLPNTITSLTLKNQQSLEEFYCEGYSDLTTLIVENTPNIPVTEIMAGASNLQRLRLSNVNFTFPTFDGLEALAEIGGLDELGANTPVAALSGSVTIQYIHTDQLARLDELQVFWPNLTITCLVIGPIWTVQFVNIDGLVLKQQYVANGQAATSPSFIPENPSTSTTYYEFTGWNKTFDAIYEDTTITATYTQATGTINIGWYVDGVHMAQRTNYPKYKLHAHYPKDKNNNLLSNTAYAWAPTLYSPGKDLRFAGWSPEPEWMTRDIDYYATFEDWNVSKTRIGDFLFSAYNTGTSGQITIPATVEYIGLYAFTDRINFHLNSLPPALKVLRERAFLGIGSMNLTSLPNGIERVENLIKGGTTTGNNNNIPFIPASVKYLGIVSNNTTTITFLGTPEYIVNNAFGTEYWGSPNLTTINVPWSYGEVPNAPWGATNVTINYDYVSEGE